MKILLGRAFLGFGDWVMFTSLITHINRQYPDYIVDVDTTRLGLFYLQFLCKFDIRVTPVSKPCLSNYDVHIDHVTYSPVRRPGEHLLEAMINQFNTASGLCIEYIPHLLARYVGKVDSPREHDRADKSVLICPENGLAKSSLCKDWGWDNFMTLAHRLMKADVEVIQIGIGTASPLWPGCHTYYKNLTLGSMLSLMRRSKATVTLENGISHFAGHHGIKTYTIYRPTSPTKPEHTYYPGQIALTGEIIDPEQLAMRIVEETNEVQLI